MAGRRLKRSLIFRGLTESSLAGFPTLTVSSGLYGYLQESDGILGLHFFLQVIHSSGKVGDIFVRLRLSGVVAASSSRKKL